MAEINRAPQQYDNYIQSVFAPEDDILIVTRAEMAKEGLPHINVSASEGKTLHTLVKISGARRILEIGTLGGYSAIWLARALPEDGSLISLELDPHHAEVARRNVERAGLAGKVHIITGPAAQSLKQMQIDGEKLFDLIFIDADKDGYVEYLELCYPLVRQGGLILADNTLPDAVLTSNGDSGTKRYNTAASIHPGLTSIILPVLRAEGLDGLTVSIKA